MVTDWLPFKLTRYSVFNSETKMASDRFSESEKKKLELLLETKQNHEAERDKLANRITQLDQKILESQETYGAIYNKNAPILKLPIEITCLIFSFSLAIFEEEEEEDNSSEGEDGPEEAGVEEAGDPEKYLMEVIISHVCHQWRKVALDFPPLWSSFCYQGLNCHRVPIDRLSAYLDRSGSQLLEIWLEFSHNEDPLHLPLLQKAVAHVERWKHVTILADRQTPVGLLIPLLREMDAPNLEYFAMCPDIPYSWNQYTELNLTPKVFMKGAPKLRSVWLDGSGPYVCLPPLFNVTTLRIEELGDMVEILFSWQMFLDILAIPTLENLSLVGTTFSQPTTDEMNLIAINNLRHLRYSDNDFITQVLPYLRAPRLETLIIKDTEIGLEEVTFSTPAEPYSFPSLKELALIQTTIVDPNSSYPFAVLFSSVKELLLSYDNPEDCILRNFPWLKDPVSKMWPDLEVITCNFDCNYADPTYPDFFVEMIKCRVPRSMTYRILDEHLRQWQASAPLQLKILEVWSDIEELDPDFPLDRTWPPDEVAIGYIAAHANEDPFYIAEYF